jgi:hypothetical protein
LIIENGNKAAKEKIRSFSNLLKIRNIKLILQ